MKDELRKTCLPLMETKDISSCKLLLDKFINCLYIIAIEHNYDEVRDQIEADSRGMFQMFLTKALNIRQNLNGIEYHNDEMVLNNIIDPTILYTLIRNLFEAVCAFELIHQIPESDGTRSIAYNLYKIASYSYRQRFITPDASPELTTMLEEEKNEITRLTLEIKESETYKALDQQGQDAILNAIKRKNYQIIIRNGTAKFYGWGDIPPFYGLGHNLLKSMYTEFSLYAHPSYISLLQFAEMFKKDNPEFINSATYIMKHCFTLLSVLIADYICLFPQVKETYMAMSQEDQILLNFHNKLFRGEEKSICDTWKLLE